MTWDAALLRDLFRPIKERHHQGFTAGLDSQTAHPLMPAAVLINVVCSQFTSVYFLSALPANSHLLCAMPAPSNPARAAQLWCAIRQSVHVSMLEIIGNNGRQVELPKRWLRERYADIILSI